MDTKSISVEEVQAMINEVVLQRDSAQQRCAHLGATVARLTKELEVLKNPIVVESTDKE